MAIKGFRDLRTPDELQDVPGNPAKKVFVRSLVSTSFVTGALQFAQRIISAISGSASLGVQLVENVKQTRHPRHPNEPSGSRLSRGEVAGTIVAEKLQNRLSFVQIGSGTPGFFGQFLTAAARNAAAEYSPLIGKLFTKKKSSDGSWSEPPTPYAPVYPYNQVQESESGHIQEIDDTPGAERIHVAHRSGTFTEMHPDGSSVDKVVKDRYTITMGDNFVSITGECHINVNGPATVFVHGDLNAQVQGGAAISAKKNIKMFSQNIEMHAQRQITLDAPVIDLTYIKLPSSFKPVPSWPALTTTNGMPIKTKTVLAPVTNKISYNADTDSIEGLDDVSPQVQPPEEIPLQNPALYQDATPAAVDQRSRMFDSPDEVQDLHAYTSHVELSMALEDFAVNSKRIPGVYRNVDEALPLLPEPPVIVGDFLQWKNTFTFAKSTTLSTRYTLQDMLPQDTRTAVVSTDADIQPQSGLLQDELVYNLSLLATNVLDPIRDQYPDMTIEEAFRESNTGQTQHEEGQAADIRFPNLDANGYFTRATWIRDNVAYDQLILNWTNVGDSPWIHISYVAEHRRRVVYTKDYMDVFYEGLRIVDPYATEADQTAAVEVASAEAASLQSDLDAEAAREALRTPVTAADPGITGGVAATDGTIIKGYTPQWNGVSQEIDDRVAELAIANPIAFAGVATGNTAFIVIVVTDLRGQGYPVAVNGFHGSIADVATDSIVFANPTGVGDGSNTYEGLEIYRVVTDGAAAFDDLTPDLLQAGYVGAWVLP